MSKSNFDNIRADKSGSSLRVVPDPDPWVGNHCPKPQGSPVSTSLQTHWFQWHFECFGTNSHTPLCTVQQNAAIRTQTHSGTRAWCVKSSVNTNTHSGVNNCRYLLQRREQWREASPQILKALSVSGTANRKSNLLCHTETCLTTLNNCTAALERAVFLLSNEGLQGREHGCVCVCYLCVCDVKYTCFRTSACMCQHI